MKHPLLGELSAREFLHRHWQKRPLLVRGALPGFRGALGLRALTALAARDDVESRTVERRGRRYITTQGPFAKDISFRSGRATLLVSGVNLHVGAADRLLRRFDFLPQARLDDVMVSYALSGGGVGPHVDSYDVFLLQGPGRRRWRVWKGSEIFCQHITAPGDLLYLPPGWKHDGVALEPCFTYSIGFRAPRGAELAASFLDWLHERGFAGATYRDPGLRPTAQPGQIPAEMIAFSKRYLDRIAWSRSDVADALGRYLSGPKQHVVFRSRRGPLRGSKVVLDPKTQLLYSGNRFFMNGESFSLPPRQGRAMRVLADQREIPMKALASACLTTRAAQWYRMGYLTIGKPG